MGSETSFFNDFPVNVHECVFHPLWTIASTLRAEISKTICHFIPKVFRMTSSPLHIDFSFAAYLSSDGLQH